MRQFDVILMLLPTGKTITVTVSAESATQACTLAQDLNPHSLSVEANLRES